MVRSLSGSSGGLDSRGNGRAERAFARGTLGLVAGYNDNTTAAGLALVIPSGNTLAVYDFSSSLLWGNSGSVNASSCALNGAGTIGLVAGYDDNVAAAGLALVIPSGNALRVYDFSSSLSSDGGDALGCALNGGGTLGLVAGYNTDSTTGLALVVPSGNTLAVYDFSSSLSSWGDGGASGCALNGAGTFGLVAGQTAGRTAGLAVVMPSGDTLAVHDASSLLSSWGAGGVTYGCALNGGGTFGLVVGENHSSGFAAAGLALVTRSGDSFTLYDFSSSLPWGVGSGASASGCALNDAGTLGLVAGYNYNMGIAGLAVVIPSGGTLAVYDFSTSLPWGNGNASSCALNGAGTLGLVAGYNRNTDTPGLAVVIPSSHTLTVYDFSTSLPWGSGSVSGCALGGLAQALTPTAIGSPASSVSYTVLSESAALSAHGAQKKSEPCSGEFSGIKQ